MRRITTGLLAIGAVAGPARVPSGLPVGGRISAVRRSLAVASLLFLGALTLQQCQSRAGDEPRAGDRLPFKPVATVDQVMDGIVIPSSQALFDAIVYSNGELISAPKTDDDWFRLQMHGLAVAEAGNLLMMAPRARDNGEWMRLSAALVDQGVAAAKAAEAKDLDALFEAGGPLYEACLHCHERYISE